MSHETPYYFLFPGLGRAGLKCCQPRPPATENERIHSPGEQISSEDNVGKRRGQLACRCSPPEGCRAMPGGRWLESRRLVDRGDRATIQGGEPLRIPETPAEVGPAPSGDRRSPAAPSRARSVLRLHREDQSASGISYPTAACRVGSAGERPDCPGSCRRARSRPGVDPCP